MESTLQPAAEIVSGTKGAAAAAREHTNTTTTTTTDEPPHPNPGAGPSNAQPTEPAVAEPQRPEPPTQPHATESAPPQPQPQHQAPVSEREQAPPGPSLRDHLLAALATHPGTRMHHLHALVSVPRRTSEPYPFATPKPPRMWVQDILVLLAESALDGEGEEKKERETEGETARPSTPPPGGSKPARVLTTAISASLFLVPATASGLLYIGKVDTTGQAQAPSPAALLVRALIAYYADPATRPAPARGLVRHLWVHVFARAQAQYLFSASREAPGKRPLGDAQLCAWWRRLLGRVGGELRGRAGVAGVRMRYVLPGMGEEEAARALREGGGAEGWGYGHPYGLAEEGVPLPCPPPPPPPDVETGAGTKRKAGTGMNLGCVIPWFDDDPKSRFMDEIAYTTGEVRSPQRKRAKTDKDKDKGKEAAAGDAGRPLGELALVSADEFWERMSFRQECVAGAITGFFTVVVSAKEGGAGVVPAALGAERGQVSGQVHKRILTTLLEGVEFSTRERAERATETMEAAIRGLCEGGVPTLPAPATPGAWGVGTEAVAVGAEGISGSVATRNGAGVGRRVAAAEAVRVLAVRRKKKA